MALLTSSNPSDWKDLQNQVAAILDECGMTVHTERKFKTVRGSVELDVYAEEVVKGRRYSIACECKHWQSRVPQTVIHAFRTVVSDLGVNIGYIISSSGFQSGAFDASESTNVRLLTWEEYQDEFCSTWIANHLSPTISTELEPIISNTGPIVPTWFTHVPDNEVPALRSLRDKYMPFGSFIMLFTQSAHSWNPNGIPNLPVRNKVRTAFSDSSAIPDAIMDAIGYRDFLGLVMEYGRTAIAEFDAVKQRSNM